MLMVLSMKGEAGILLFKTKHPPPQKKKTKQFCYPALYSDAPPSSEWGCCTYSIAHAFSIGIFCGNSCLNPWKLGVGQRARNIHFLRGRGFQVCHLSEVTDSCTVKNLCRPHSPSALVWGVSKHAILCLLPQREQMESVTSKAHFHRLSGSL